MPPYYENTSVNFCSDHTYFGTRIDNTLHYLGLAYPQNIFHFSNLPFHYKVLIQQPCSIVASVSFFLFPSHSFISICLQRITLTTNSVQVRMLYVQIVAVGAHFGSLLSLLVFGPNLFGRQEFFSRISKKVCGYNDALVNCPSKVPQGVERNYNAS